MDTVHPVLESRLTAAGFACIAHWDTPREKLLVEISQATGIVIRSRITINREFIDAATGLKFIARSGSGLENIDVEYARSKGIVLFNSPEGNRDAVAEHVLAMLLTLFDKLNKADREVRQGMWDREGNRGIELAGKTVAIIGYGVMGSAVAERLSGFRCRILAHDKFKSGFGSSTVEESDLLRIFEEADIVSLHLPLTAETTGYVNAGFLNQFRKSIYLINTARGKNVVTADLVEAMKSGRVSGACLDVLEYEKASLEGLDISAQPPPLQYLMSSPNTVLTPHVAGWTVESYEKLSAVLAEKILKWKG
ncbi:MAG: hydroxyacid dehydrogenase [Flavobacteriales bacterium]|nr:hydroxyacid dehydrogenase [Flavobacteriales bacterium]